MVRWRLTECKVLDNVHPEAIGGSNHCQKRYEKPFPNRVGPRMPRVHSSIQPSFIGMKQAHYTWVVLGAFNLKDRIDTHIKTHTSREQSEQFSSLAASFTSPRQEPSSWTFFLASSSSSLNNSAHLLPPSPALARCPSPVPCHASQGADHTSSGP